MKKIFLLIICNLSLLSAGFAQWEQANNGLYGGSINVLTVDPTTNYIYAGTDYNGIFLSTDYGSSWTKVS